MDVGNCGRHRHAVQGVYTIDGGWWVAGMVNVQVDGVLCWGRRSVVSAMERCYDYEQLLMGGRYEEEVI